MEFCRCPAPALNVSGPEPHCEKCGLWWRPGQGSTPARYMARPNVTCGRNDPCPCRSRKKFKHCCGAPGADRGPLIVAG
ncbi:MAG: SEC-C metal-binding domain-containing protein [Chthoniobacteraceae bacterium]